MLDILVRYKQPGVQELTDNTFDHQTRAATGDFLNFLLLPLPQVDGLPGDNGLQSLGKDECGQGQQGDLWREDRKMI